MIKVMRIMASIFLGLCVGTGLASLMKGDTSSAVLMALMSVINLISVTLFIITDREDK